MGKVNRQKYKADEVKRSSAKRKGEKELLADRL